ncbi:hypothetical protein ACFL27_23570 [candidate division CSSED10-310 bacterium]|uniref:Glycosyltransferase family 1 protein n=1 Tax=candidate division CSSED10-310 bacterium TaxID=2855610 RepID=A0ABV6Z428_UNCC1
MKKIKIFYHFFACCPEYTLWLDEQLGLVRECGLSKLSFVDVCISHTGNISVDKVVHYIKENFRGVVGSVMIIPKDKHHLHEGATLGEVFKFSQQNDGYKILYFHSKGIGKTITDKKNPFNKEKFPFGFVYHHRQNIQNFCIKNHIKCMQELDHVDVTGPRFRLFPVPYFSGNFWWANSSYIKTLQSPLNEDRFNAEINWDTVSKVTAWRIRRIKNKIPAYTRWGRSANEFWICNNTVFSDGACKTKLPKIKLSIMWRQRRHLFQKL